MGFANAAASCQQVMQKVLQGLLFQKCLVYSVDVLMFGPTKNEMLDNLAEFLEHVVSESGLSADPDKIDIVKKWSTPTSADELRSFLGLTGYYRAFIPAYSSVAFPLQRLTERGRSFDWSAECEEAFTQLKQALAAAPILMLPNLDPKAPPFILDIDASGHAIGAVLS
uniref:RT_RNaseH_2 domain-containing protein n=1 Tax=Mesocestoides corti TaxID=53468 RepID=A0A5K3G7W6_MESCO